MSYQVIFTDELYHHGVRGQKWGVRRYQNTDGSYKSGAQGRYNDDGSPGVNKSRGASGGKSSGGGKSSKVKTGSKKDSKASKSKGPKKKMSTKKKVAIGLGVAGTALAAYGAYRYTKHIKDTARKDILDKGKAAAESHLSKAKIFNSEAERAKKFGHENPLYSNMSKDKKNRMIKFDISDNKRKADSFLDKASQEMESSRNRANKTGKSFKESYRYVKDQKRKGTLGKTKWSYDF